MDAQTFLDNFATIAGAPGGVQRLRDLVLDLSLRGDLSDRRATDIPVEESLSSAWRQLKALESTREVQKLTSARSVDAPPHGVPASWRWEPLGRIAAILDFRRQPVKQADRMARIQGKPPEELYPYYGATQQAGLIDDYLFDEELALLGEDGAPFLTAGKHVAYVATGKYWVNNHAHVLRGLAATNRYLVLALNRVDFTDFVTGTTRLKLTQGKMVQLPVPVPPLAEQERIVAKVDELMGLCDGLEANQERRHRVSTQVRASALHALTHAESPDDLRHGWDRVSANWPTLTESPSCLGDLRDTVVQLAVEGRLSSGRAGDDPAESILDECRQRKADLVEAGGRSRSDLAPISEDEIPFPLPRGWVLARLDHWCEIAGGVAKGRKTGGKSTVALPYLRVANVKAGYLALDEVKKIEVTVDEVDRYSLLPGDVLLTEGGDWDKLGRSAIWTGEIEPCLHQNHVFRARSMSDSLRPEWISLYTNSEAGRAYFQSKAKRTTNLASINMTELRSMPLPVPPAAEQVRILTAIEDLTSQLTRLSRALAQKENACARLTSGLSRVASG